MTKGSSQIYLCLDKRVLQTNFPSVVLGQCLLDVWLIELASYSEMVLSLICLYILWVVNEYNSNTLGVTLAPRASQNLIFMLFVNLFFIYVFILIFEPHLLVFRC